MPTQRAMEIFQSTPSVWRETPYIWLTRLQLRNFNPLPPYGGRLHNQLQSTATTRFQSTPSVWRERGISIHSLRMEGDIFRNKNRTRTAYFNPLPPYGGRQHYAALVLVSADISIHSLRMEGDRASRTLMGISQYFNSLPPYGGRRGNSQTFGEWLEISIHSLRMEGDSADSPQSGQSDISIHSLRMEGDNCSHRVTLQNVHFNPLPPYGGRPERRCLAMKRFKFQSTPSVWRETFCSSAFRDTLSFQSTPSAWRETVQLLHLDMSVIFQSTPSAWRETHAIVRVDAPNYISIHSLRMEGDCRSPIAALRILHFNPLPPHGGRPIGTTGRA